MKIVLAFDSGHPSLGNTYGDEILRLILSGKVLQQSKSSVRIAVGDLLTNTHIHATVENPTWEDVANLNQEILSGMGADHVDRDALLRLTGRSEVTCWMIENIHPDLAELMHESLLNSSSAYLGMTQARFDKLLHWRFLANGLVRKYRIVGNTASMLFSMGNQIDADFGHTEMFENNGFVVTREDTGLRWTIFDDYVTDHALAKRVAVFEDLVVRLPGIDAVTASDFSFFIEELHPNLFNSLHALVRAIDRAETVEELSHAALSGRRFLQAFADYLYPPKRTNVSGRDLGPEMYKNRIWAYIGDAVGQGTPTQSDLGRRVDSLYNFFNSSVHADRSRKEVELECAELVRLVSDIIRANPTAARDPYQAYGKAFRLTMK